MICPLPPLCYMCNIFALLCNSLTPRCTQAHTCAETNYVSFRHLAHAQQLSVYKFPERTPEYACQNTLKSLKTIARNHPINSSISSLCAREVWVMKQLWWIRWPNPSARPRGHTVRTLSAITSSTADSSKNWLCPSFCSCAQSKTIEHHIPLATGRFLVDNRQMIEVKLQTKDFEHLRFRMWLSFAYTDYSGLIYSSTHSLHVMSDNNISNPNMFESTLGTLGGASPSSTSTITTCSPVQSGMIKEGRTKSRRFPHALPFPKCWFFPGVAAWGRHVHAQTSDGLQIFRVSQQQ